MRYSESKGIRLDNERCEIVECVSRAAWIDTSRNQANYGLDVRRVEVALGAPVVVEQVQHVFDVEVELGRGVAEERHRQVLLDANIEIRRPVFVELAFALDRAAGQTVGIDKVEECRCVKARIEVDQRIVLVRRDIQQMSSAATTVADVACDRDTVEYGADRAAATALEERCDAGVVSRR